MIPQSAFFLFFGALILVLLALNFFISEKDSFVNSKQSWFESGIENKSSSRNSFSINFFLICVVFVMFDMEIIFLFNFIMKIPSEYFLEWTTQLGFLILFFFGTLILEWKLNSLSWKY